ncbi:MULTISPECIES: flagellar hook-length control protein FliK [unclassified Legionella]|uniref:flagellar hook-length control protein FliK n=1 Tax=unclassified Legionella TaxID=2622702 RepID=UPI001054D621|nr:MULTISPECIES: flagellar hook-length control protein FliK [unclassified Legionella]MDI9818622.1 flagellar hook-length control protein FliK [Legionella sp. PL877]
MAVDISYNPIVRLNPTQELKITKADTELYVGQILKTVVVKALSESQVLININGQNINAKTSHHLTPGELLQAKVIQTKGEVVLQILGEKPSSLNPIQTALAQAIPRQAPATYLFATLSAFENMPNIPAAIQQQIQQLLGSISPLNQLPQQLAQALVHSGFFLENVLLQWRHNKTNDIAEQDFKAQCLRLLALLCEEGSISSVSSNNPMKASYQDETLPLPGAIPQPLPRFPSCPLNNQSLDDMLMLLQEQTGQTLERIKTGQLMHLLNSPDQPYSLMIDLPVKTQEGPEIIPLLIQEERQLDTSASAWSISFAVNLSNLGDIQAKIKLQKTIIDINLNSDNPATLELLALCQPIFADLLKGSGLTLGLWGLHLGLQDGDIDTSNLHLLDIRI